MNYITEYNTGNKYYTDVSPNSHSFKDVKPIYINKNDILYIKNRLGINTPFDIHVNLTNINGPYNCYIFFYNNKTGEIGNLNTMNNVHKKNIREVIITSYLDEWYKVTIDDRVGVDCSNVYWCDQIEGVVQCVKDSIDKDVYNINESSSLDLYDSVMSKISNISNSSYYQELSDEDKNMLSNNMVSMTNSDYNKLLYKFKSFDYYSIGTTDSKNYLSARSDWLNIHIYSCIDEWFIVLAVKYYKCDQLSGVIKLIDDIQNCIDK